LVIKINEILPRRFGRYVLTTRISSGGMGEVYRAKLIGERGFEKVVAIKAILPHLAGDEEFISMLFDEARI